MILILTFQGAFWGTSKNKNLRDKKTQVSALVPILAVFFCTPYKFTYNYPKPQQQTEVKPTFVMCKKNHL